MLSPSTFITQLSTTFLVLPPIRARSDGTADDVDRLGREVRPDGQAQNLTGQLLRDGEITTLESHARVSTTQMRGNGIVNDRLDALTGKMLLQSISLGMTNNEKVPDGIGPRGKGGQKLKD